MPTGQTTPSSAFIISALVVLTRTVAKVEVLGFLRVTHNLHPVKVVLYHKTDNVVVKHKPLYHLYSVIGANIHFGSE